MSVLYEDLRYDMIMSVYENENEMRFAATCTSCCEAVFGWFCAGKEGRKEGMHSMFVSEKGSATTSTVS
jgi:hypothetical protein